MSDGSRLVKDLVRFVKDKGLRRDGHVVSDDVRKLIEDGEEYLKGAEAAAPDVPAAIAKATSVVNDVLVDYSSKGLNVPELVKTASDLKALLDQVSKLTQDFQAGVAAASSGAGTTPPATT